MRLRVNELTSGAEVPWYVSRVQAPFLFFERTAAAPQGQPDHVAELLSKPIGEFGASDAYLTALGRDTLRGYEEFLAAYPNDPLARRVRAILAARREAATWRDSAVADTPEAYWSYLRRYPHGPHAADARRRLAHYAAALEPPPSFAAITYDVPPPPPDEIVYVERPYIYFADPVFDLPPPPQLPVLLLPPRPAYFVELLPPPPPIDAFVLPCPVYYPVPLWVERPAYVVPAPVNVVSVNIHNTVVVNQANRTIVVTNPSGQQVPPIATNFLSPRPGQQRPIQASAVATAAIAVAAVPLPAAAALRSKQMMPVAARSGAPGQLAVPQLQGQPTANRQQRPGELPPLPTTAARRLLVPFAPTGDSAKQKGGPHRAQTIANRASPTPAALGTINRPGQPVSQPIARGNGGRPLAAVVGQPATVVNAQQQRQSRRLKQRQQQAAQQRGALQRQQQLLQRRQHVQEAARHSQQAALQTQQQLMRQSQQQQQAALHRQQQFLQQRQQQAAQQRQALLQRAQQRQVTCGHRGVPPCR